MSRKIIVAGIGTEVGKTVVSAILITMTKGEYWKPIQCGDKDTDAIQKLIAPNKHRIHECNYSFKAHLSPHHAATLENRTIDCSIFPPKTANTLIIEGVGGILTPLTQDLTALNLFSRWECEWIIVSTHYLGSINHTLLTIDALKRKKCAILGLIFNGDPYLDGESAILEISQLPLLGRLKREKKLDPKIIQRYAKTWTFL